MIEEKGFNSGKYGDNTDISSFSQQIGPELAAPTCQGVACRVALVVLAVVLLIAGAVSAGILFSSIGYPALGCLGAAVAGLIILAIVLCRIKPISVEGAQVSTTSGKTTVHEKIANKPDDQPYFPLGQEAFDFAEQELKNHPEITPREFPHKGLAVKYRPLNPKIDLLKRLYDEVFYKALEKAVGTHFHDPWSQEEVIQAADACMKIGYVITCLTLKDLVSVLEQLKQDGDPQTYAYMLYKQESYLLQTHYCCVDTYQLCKNESKWTWNELKNKWEMGNQSFLTPKHSRRYSQTGTPQHNWKLLHNDYCERVSSYVVASDFSDERHAALIKKDEEDFSENSIEEPFSAPTVSHQLEPYTKVTETLQMIVTKVRHVKNWSDLDPSEPGFIRQIKTRASTEINSCHGYLKNLNPSTCSITTFLERALPGLLTMVTCLFGKMSKKTNIVWSFTP